MKNGLAKNIAEQIIAQIPMVGKWRSAFRKHSTPGHFYSPIPDLVEVRRREAKIFAAATELYGIDLSPTKQLALLNEIVSLLPEAPWANEPRAGLLYQYQNLYYGPGDGLTLYGIMRTMKPSKIIEVGSGWSSAVMLDVNKQFFDNSINLTFIEPNPERLLEVTKGVKVEFRREFVQEVPLSTYDELDENDVLFIDTSHVSKVGSDVNFIIFDILPRLSSGVLVHFHDIFFPFEYPKEWIYQGYAWNENYLLRAYLTNNSDYEIVFMNTYLETLYPEQYPQEMDTRAFGQHAGSIWLRKR